MMLSRYLKNYFRLIGEQTIKLTRWLLPVAPERSLRLRAWYPYLLILFFGLALYGRTIFFDFTYLDDNALIIENYHVLQDVRNIGAIFASDVFLSPDKSYYRPMLNLSFLPEAMATEPTAALFHLGNIILHILASALLFLFLKKLGQSRPWALFFSLVFLVHPTLTQAVAWIPGRNDSLLAVFILAAWITFINFSLRPRLWTYLGYLLFFFLALMTKENAIVLPLLIAYYFLYLRPERINQHDRWLLLGGSGAVMFLWFLLRHLALGGPSWEALSMLSSFFSSAAIWLVYLGKIMWPANLSLLPTLADSSLIYGLLSVGLFVLVILRWRLRAPKMAIFGLAWFVLFLAPSLFLSAEFPYFLEHRLYLPMIGFILLAAELKIWQRIYWRQPIVLIVAAGLLLGLAGLSWQHSRHFRDRLTFWQTAAAMSPKAPLAHRNLGAMYYLAGDYDSALAHYRVALDLNAQEVMAHNNIGLIYLEREQLDLAEQEFLRELEINPAYDKALFNLAELYYRQNRLAEAKFFWQEVIKVNPGHAGAYVRLLNQEKPLQY